MEKEIQDIDDKKVGKPTFPIGLRWGCLLSIPLWTICIFVLWYIIKS